MGHVFVSYSRTEYYCAESVAAVIDESDGVRAWLDTENLRPGTDWADGIDSALTEADAVLLMASPAAMRSSYVRAEWEQAVSAKIPVYVAVVRTVRLPEELAHCPTYDLRARFWLRSRRLAGDLARGEHGGARTVRRSPVVPLAVLLLMALSCIGVAAAVWAALLDWNLHVAYSFGGENISVFGLSVYDERYARFFLALTVANATVGGGLVVVLSRLLARRATPSSIRQGFGALLLVMGFNALTPERIQEAAITQYFGYVMVVAVCGAAVVSWSRTVHLWMPTGEGEHHVRQRIVGRPLVRPTTFRRDLAYVRSEYQPRFAPPPEPLPDVDATGGYRVVHDPADRPIGDLIARACDTAGLVRDDVFARWTFVVVSARTDWDIGIRQRARLDASAVFVLASSVVLPRGFDVDASLIRRHQWLDFRDQGPGALHALVHSVAPERRDSLVPVTVPASMDRFHGPPYLGRHLLAVRLVVFLVVFGPLGLLVANASAWLQALPLIVVTAVLVTLLLRLAWRTATRLITAAQWRFRARLILGVSIGWSLLVGMANLPPLVRILVPVVLAISLTRSYRALRPQWLPLAPVRGRGGLGAVAPPTFSFSLAVIIVACSAGMVLLAPLPVIP